MNLSVRILAGAISLLVPAFAAQAQPLSGDELIQALRKGGYVIVMRHASSPREAPDAQSADPDNVNRERQLDEGGRATATAMGNALRKLKIPIGPVFSSPTYRARETVRLARLGNPQPVPELGDGGRSMQASSEAQAVWLRKKVTEFPKGTNLILVTHFPNISAAFPYLSSGMADGESLIFGPDHKGGAILVARVKIEEWPRYAGE
jgi:phosphohistidine phosphatase SixA